MGIVTLFPLQQISDGAKLDFYPSKLLVFRGIIDCSDIIPQLSAVVIPWIKQVDMREETFLDMSTVLEIWFIFGRN